MIGKLPIISMNEIVCLIGKIGSFKWGEALKRHLLKEEGISL